MRILYFTDTHIRGTNPKNRKDDFVKSLESKFEEIVDIVNTKDIDYVIHGGDLFDRPDISISVVSKFTNIIKKIKVPIYIVSGNHDIFGHNPATIDRTMLGLLKSLDFLIIVDKDNKIILEKDGIRVQLTGLPYSYNIDSSSEGYILTDIAPNIDYSIHIVHGMLLDRPFVKGIPYTLVDDIIETKADITLSGHYHAGFKTIEKNGKYFINPGSLVRITNSLKEIERIPKLVLIELKDKITIETLTLKSAKPGEEVLDRSEIEKSSFRGERIIEFKQTIDSAINFEKMDINDLLLEVTLSENLSDQVKEEALKRLAQIQMKDI
ncbi:MAG: metallophosphoesterase family protein [Gudongella sp.]|nr:metallophosphoesterase family protein [Gudongella sp.]